MTRIWWISTWALEILKTSTLIGSFIQSRKCMSLKFTEELCIWCKIWGGIGLSFQNWHEQLDKFWPRALRSFKNVHFNGLPLNKIYNDWAKKEQISYVWWHWRLKQNLKENRFVLSKMIWGIWQIFTRAFEKSQNWDFWWILLSKVENVWA